MGLLDILKTASKPDKETDNKNTLEQDIRESSEWVVKALNSSGYKADYSLESMKEVDRFFDEQNAENGILANNRGQIIFALGSYIGETAIKLYGGRWITNDDEPNGEINIAVEVSNGTVIWPVKRCMRRYTNGAKDSIHDYIYVLNK